MDEQHFQEWKAPPETATRAPADTPSSEMAVICPQCCRPTEDLKSYDVLALLCLLVYIGWSSGNVTACPSCMRRVLFRRLLVSIPLSNVLFPVAGAVYLGQILATFAQGHSEPAIANACRMGRDQRLALLQSKIHRRRTPRREWIILAAILALIAGFWGGLYAYAVIKRESAEPSAGGKSLTLWIQDLDAAEAPARAKAANILGQMGPPAAKAVPKLQQLARNDESALVRIEAYRALHAIDPASIQGIPMPGLPLPGGTK
jgi:hypothetical protein